MKLDTTLGMLELEPYRFNHLRVSTYVDGNDRFMIDGEAFRFNIGFIRSNNTFILRRDEGDDGLSDTISLDHYGEYDKTARVIGQDELNSIADRIIKSVQPAVTLWYRLNGDKWFVDDDKKETLRDINNKQSSIRSIENKLAEYDRRIEAIRIQHNSRPTAMTEQKYVLSCWEDSDRRSNGETRSRSTWRCMVTLTGLLFGQRDKDTPLEMVAVLISRGIVKVPETGYSFKIDDSRFLLKPTNSTDPYTDEVD